MKLSISIALIATLAFVAPACNEANGESVSINGSVSPQHTSNEQNPNTKDSLSGISVEPGTVGRKYNDPTEDSENYIKEYKATRLAEAKQKLASTDAEERQSALRSLRNRDSKEHSLLDAVLVILKEDESRTVRMTACDALAEIGPGNDKVMHALIEALDDESTWVQAHAAENLAPYGKAAEAALPRLIELISVGDEWLSDDAALAARQIDPQAVIRLSHKLRGNLLSDDIDEQMCAVIALGAIGPIPSPADPNSIALDAVAPETERFHPDISFFPRVYSGYKDPLQEMQGDLHPELEGIVDDLLWILPSPQELKTLPSSSEYEGETGLARITIQTIGKFQHHANDAVPTLISFLGHSTRNKIWSDEERWAVATVEKAIRVEAAIALMRIASEDPDQIQEILRLVNSRDDSKKYAVRMIGSLGENAGEHMAWLGEAVKADDAANTVFDVIEEVGAVAAHAVPGLIDFLPRAQFQSVAGTINSFGYIGSDAKEAIPAMIKKINDPGMFSMGNPMDSDQVLKSIAQIDPGGKETLDLIIESLEGQGQFSTRAALESCRWLETGSTELGRLLLKQFDNSDGNCRLLAARAIIPYAIENPDILDALVGLLGDQNSSVQVAAYSAFVEITLAKPELKVNLEELLRYEPNCYLDFAPLVLGLALDDRGTSRQLTSVFPCDDQFMRVYAYEELSARGAGMDMAIPALIEQSKVLEQQENRRMAAAICRINPSRATPLIPDLINQLNCGFPESEIQAAWLLGEIGSYATSALDALEIVTYDWNLSVREEAARAIAKINSV